MAYVRAIPTVTLFLLTLWLVPAALAAPKPADQAFRFSVALGEEQELELNWSIEPGYYLYRAKFAATLGGKKLKLTTAPGEMKDDPTFGATEVYHNKATAYVEPVAETGKILVTYQGCAENSICYPPITKAIDLATLAVSQAGPGDRFQALAPVEPVGAASVTADASPSADKTPDLSGGFASTLLAFLGFGLLIAFTPCTFPMLPILSGVLTRSAGELSIGRAFTLSASYVLAMASAYGVLGIFAAWFGGNLQTILQTPIAISLMSAMFVVFALGMFGLYELQLPDSLARLAPSVGKSGSVGSAAVLGFTSALIVGPCVTPPLAAALIYVAQTGNAVRGSAALFALGLGMGLPLLMLGTFGAKMIPKSGPWLIRVKEAFGVLLIGMAVWMMSRILPLPLIPVSWGIFALGVGAWIIAPELRQWGADRRWRRFASVAGALVFGLYGGLLLVGATVGWYEALLPLEWAGIAPSASAMGLAQDHFQVVFNEVDLDAAITRGREEKRPILIDFSADWCTECRLMERTVLADQNVRQQLDTLQLIRVDVTHYDGDSKKMMDRFSVVGPPTLIFLNSGGKEVEKARTVGATVVDEFLSKITMAQRG